VSHVASPRERGLAFVFGVRTPISLRGKQLYFNYTSDVSCFAREPIDVLTAFAIWQKGVEIEKALSKAHDY